MAPQNVDQTCLKDDNLFLVVEKYFIMSNCMMILLMLQTSGKIIANNRSYRDKNVERISLPFWHKNSKFTFLESGLFPTKINNHQYSFDTIRDFKFRTLGTQHLKHLCFNLSYYFYIFRNILRMLEILVIF